MEKIKEEKILCFVLGRVDTEFYLKHYDIALLELENAKRIIEKELEKYNKKK